MSGPTLESVLLSSLMDEYGADEETWRALRSLSRVEAAVLAWIEGRLADGDVQHWPTIADPGIRCSCGWTISGVKFSEARHRWRMHAVRGVLGEGSSTEGGRK